MSRRSAERWPEQLPPAGRGGRGSRGVRRAWLLVVAAGCCQGAPGRGEPANEALTEISMAPNRSVDPSGPRFPSMATLKFGVLTPVVFTVKFPAKTFGALLEFIFRKWRD